MPSASLTENDFYLTHQTEIDPLPPPPSNSEADTVVRIKGVNETYTAHASDDTCEMSSHLMGEEGNQPIYASQSTDNADDWKQLARKLDKIVFAVIFTLMVLSAVCTLTVPFLKKYSPASGNH